MGRSKSPSVRRGRGVPADRYSPPLPSNSNKSTPSKSTPNKRKSFAGDPADRIGTSLLTHWPKHGWHHGKVIRYLASSGKYEAKYEDGTLVLLSKSDVERYAVSANASPEEEAKAQESTPSSVAAVGGQGFPPVPNTHTLGFNGAAIVVLSALMSYGLAVCMKGKANGIATSIVMMFGNGTLCLLGSWCFEDYSWTDRVWSVTPFFYTLYFAYDSQWDPRCAIMAALTCLWSVRLTYNFARKGGYKIGEQDYRWPWLQKIFYNFSPGYHKILWHTFNIAFIAYYQNVLLLLLALPAAVAGQHRTPLMSLDYLAVTVFIIAFATESIADEQQWQFQLEKCKQRPRRKQCTKDYTQGFLSHGLFSYSRHPNFFGEQLLWVSIFLFSVAAIGPHKGVEAWGNYSGIGALLLILLFQGSTRVTEIISCGKYPAYSKYQKKVSMLLPLPPSA